MSSDKNAIAFEIKEGTKKKLEAKWNLNKYVATKGIFHTPAEHTVDLARAAVEFQIYFDPWTQDPDAKKSNVTVNPGKDSKTDKVAQPVKGSMNYVKPQAAIGILFKVRDCVKESKGDAKSLAKCQAEVKPSDDLFKAFDIANNKIMSAPKGGAANVLKAPMATFMASVKDKNFYHYYGSETTVPCAEGVQWAVYADYLPIDPATWKVFNDKVVMKMSYSRKNGNSRLAQPMNDRIIYYNDKGR